ncbi:MAG: hypothetical protein OXI67_05495 [Candidatus Poribacteria bacterium]|nr:hypothetical protein [Candidatus Poribacteria bacterium]
MPKRREDTITEQLVNILRYMRHGWELETRVNAFSEDNSELDAIVIEQGREPVGIEAKFATTTNAKNLITQAETRLVLELEAEYHVVGRTLNNVMAILYPERFKTMAGKDINPQLRAADDLQYKLVNTVGDTVGHFPENGWATGTVGDIANALHVGAMPNSQLEAAAEEMEKSINRAAYLLEDAIVDHPAIGKKIEAILHQEVFSKEENDTEEKPNIQTLRMAALIITDAFVFQSSLAGKTEMESVRSLRQLLPIIDYADVVEDWNTILKVNYRPIFEDARNLVEALATDDRLVKYILKLLCEAAKDLVDTGIAQIHELAGIVFQKLITDRKYVKANYTLPESAVLLSTLVMPELPKGKLPKVADFACGTGALLNGVYQRILSLYEQAGGNGRDIHQRMLEENIGGVDIMPNATHLTAAALASTYAGVKIGGTQIVTAPYGVMENKGYAIGSLELLDIPLFDTEAEQIGGEENTVVKLRQTFPHGDFDIVIQNPPFTKPGTDQGSSIPKTTFQGSDRPEEDKKAMQAVLRSKKSQIAHGLSGLASYFVDLADRKLKHGGTMGFILLATFLASSTMQKLRDMLATEYHNVAVVTITEEASEGEAAFSADTKMAECIVVATKGTGKNSGRGKFVCLNQRPQSLLEAMEIAKYVNRNNSTRRLEDIPSGGDMIRIGGDIVGQMLDCPLPFGKGWGVSRVKSMALIQSVYGLQKGIIHLPLQTTKVNVPICCVEDIAQVGWHPESVYGKNGPFDMVKGDANGEGYPCLWSLKSETQRSMLVDPDSRGIPRRNAEDNLRKILTKNSRVHYNLYLRFNANSTLALVTAAPSVGVNRLTNVAFEYPQHEIAFALWCNSTLGLMCHWIHSGKQQSGRGILTLKTLGTLPTLDVRELSDAALANAEAIFERLKYQRMLPVNECAHDSVRAELDRCLLTEVLGITSDNVLESMQTLREMLCAEPSIHGGKKSTCDLDAELVMLKRKGVAFPSWYGEG